MRILYLDLCAGISGDMSLAALLDLGVPLEHVQHCVRLITPADVRLRVETVRVHGITARRLHVELAGDLPPQPRHYPDIAAALDASGLDAGVKRTAHAIFRELATAEAKVHGTTVEQVHFHEVGAWDSIADIVGFSVALQHVAPDSVACSEVPLGRGQVQTQHGVMPLPAPATLEILKGIPVAGTDVAAELTTPTGAAIVKAVARDFGPLPRMRVEAVGWGAGHRELHARPNVLRAVLGVAEEAAAGDHDCLVETNIDDATPQVLGHVLELLLREGAVDVWLTPVHMKKNRPGVQLSVLCSTVDRERLKRLIFRETPAIGLRERELVRTRLRREVTTVPTPLGEIRAKTAWLRDEVVNVSPEFEDVRAAAARHGLSVKDALAVITAALPRPGRGDKGCAS